MSKPELTPTFDGGQKPVRDGWYQRLHAETNQFLFWYWRGAEWEVGGYERETQFCRGRSRAPHQELPWRGLASDPKAAS